MNVTIRRPWDANETLKVDNLMGQVILGESNSHTFVIYEANGTAITGTISASFMRADGATVWINGGTIVDGEAQITLPAQCYAIQGRFALSIYSTSDDTTVCIYCAVGNVFRSQTDSIVDPGTIMPSIADLIAEIERVVGTIPVDYSSLATQVSGNTSTISSLSSQVTVNRGNISTLQSDMADTTTAIGDMSELITPTKDNLVDAINEAYEYDPTAAYDTALSSSSENAVQNKAIKAALDGKMNTPTAGGTAGQCLMSDGAGSLVWGTPTEVSVVLGALATKDRVEATYTPAGTVSTPTVTVSTTKKHIFVPETASGGGSVTAGTAASCTLPTLTMTQSGMNLIMSWSAGSFTANTPTGVVLPAFADTQVVSGASATASQPTFTGTEVEIIST